MLNITARAAGRKTYPQEPEIVADGGLPPGLDPERHRIILQHWFGWQPVGAVAAQVVQDLTFHRTVKHQHAGGLG